jgi:crotonobetainyl-CoA:carnitine CoA-transferase CaiB-like acyl-CoA transferase
MGVLAALVRRDRTGLGEEVTTALTDGMISMLAFMAAHHFATGEVPPRNGNNHGLVAPYGLFEALDGQVAIAPSNDGVYFKLLDALGISDAIHERVNRVTRTQPIDHWISSLNQAGVPCGKVLNVAQVFDDPQVKHQQMRITIDHPLHGPMDVLGFPIKFTDAPCRIHRLPPELGGDSDTVLAELGYDPAHIARLHAEGVV